MIAPRFKVSLKIWSIKKSRAFFQWIEWVLEVSKQRGKVQVTNGLLLFLNRQLANVYWQLKMETINDIKRRPEERCKRRNSNCFVYVPFVHEQSGQFGSVVHVLLITNFTLIPNNRRHLSFQILWCFHCIFNFGHFFIFTLNDFQILIENKRVHIFVCFQHRFPSNVFSQKYYTSSCSFNQPSNMHIFAGFVSHLMQVWPYLSTKQKPSWICSTILSYTP